jgi:hypothetical protein
MKPKAQSPKPKVGVSSAFETRRGGFISSFFIFHSSF